MKRIVAEAVSLARKKLAERKNRQELKLELSEANRRIAKLEATVQGLEFRLEDVKRVNRRLAQLATEKRVEEKCRKTTNSPD